MANHSSIISSWVAFVYKNTNRICHESSRVARSPSLPAPVPLSAGPAVSWFLASLEESEGKIHVGIGAVFPLLIWGVTGTTNTTWWLQRLALHSILWGDEQKNMNVLQPYPLLYPHHGYRDTHTEGMTTIFYWLTSFFLSYQRLLSTCCLYVNRK